MIKKIKGNKTLTEPGCRQKLAPKYRGRVERVGIEKVTQAMTLMNWWDDARGVMR